MDLITLTLTPVNVLKQHSALISQEKLGFGTHSALTHQEKLGFGTRSAVISQEKTRVWDSQCINLQEKLALGTHNALSALISQEQLGLQEHR